MKNSRIRLITDLSYIIFIFLLFTVTAFIAIDTNFLNVNIVVFAVVSMIMIITYFSSLTVGISASAVIIFVGIAITIYLGLEKGMPIPNLLYFWCAMLPAFTVCISYISRNTNKLQKTMVALEKNIEELVTIDNLTGLKNQKQFVSDTEAYMNIAKRYNLKLALMVAELRYQSDVERIAGKQNIGEIIKHVSEALVQSVRKEDLVYIVDVEKYCFAVLMMTNDYDGINVAVSRTKKNIAEINLDDISRFANIDIDMRMGVASFEKEFASALDFLSAAKYELEFDV